MSGRPAWIEMVPSEILTMIFSFVIFAPPKSMYRYTTHLKRDKFWKRERTERCSILRLVCKSWSEICGSFRPMVEHKLSRDDLSLELMIRPFVDKISAFPMTKKFTIDMSLVSSDIFFALIRKMKELLPYLEELVLKSELSDPSRRGSKVYTRTPVIPYSHWGYSHHGFLFGDYSESRHFKHMRKLTLHGSNFGCLNKYMARYFFNFDNRHLTELHLPQLGQRRSIWNHAYHRGFYSTTEHAFCKKILVRKNNQWCSPRNSSTHSGKTPISLKTLMCLKVLTVGSFDLRCHDCLSCLPHSLEELRIAYPDVTNLVFPSILPDICKIKVVVLKAVIQKFIQFNGTEFSEFCVGEFDISKNKEIRTLFDDKQEWNATEDPYTRFLTTFDCVSAVSSSHCRDSLLLSIYETLGTDESKLMDYRVYLNTPRTDIFTESFESCRLKRGADILWYQKERIKKRK